MLSGMLRTIGSTKVTNVVADRVAEKSAQKKGVKPCATGALYKEQEERSPLDQKVSILYMRIEEDSRPSAVANWFVVPLVYALVSHCIDWLFP